MGDIKVEVIFRGRSTGQLGKSKEWLDGVKATACVLFPSEKEFNDNVKIQTTTLSSTLMERPCTGKTTDFLAAEKLGEYTRAWDPSKETWRAYLRAMIGSNPYPRYNHTVLIGSRDRGSIFSFGSGAFITGARDMLIWSGLKDKIVEMIHYPHRDLENHLVGFIQQVQDAVK